MKPLGITELENNTNDSLDIKAYMKKIEDSKKNYPSIFYTEQHPFIFDILLQARRKDDNIEKLNEEEKKRKNFHFIAKQILVSIRLFSRHPCLMRLFSLNDEEYIESLIKRINFKSKVMNSDSNNVMAMLKALYYLQLQRKTYDALYNSQLYSEQLETSILKKEEEKDFVIISTELFFNNFVLPLLKNTDSNQQIYKSVLSVLKSIMNMFSNAIETTLLPFVRLLSSYTSEIEQKHNQVGNPKLTTLLRLRVDDGFTNYRYDYTVSHDNKKMVLSDFGEKLAFPLHYKGKSFNLENYKKKYKRVFGPFSSILSHKLTMSDVMNDKEVEKIKNKLENGEDVFVTAYGTSGSGKSAFVISLYDKKVNKEIPGLTIEICNRLKNCEKLSVTFVEFEGDTSDEAKDGSVKKKNIDMEKKEKTVLGSGTDFTFDDTKKCWLSETKLHIKGSEYDQFLEQEFNKFKSQIEESEEILNKKKELDVKKLDVKGKIVPNLKEKKTSVDKGKEEKNEENKIKEIKKIITQTKNNKFIHYEDDVFNSLLDLWLLSDEKRKQTIKEKTNYFRKMELGEYIKYVMESKRHIAATLNNPVSSRSHVMIFINLTLNLEVKPLEQPLKQPSEQHKKNVLFIISDNAGVENVLNCSSQSVLQGLKDVKIQCKEDTCEKYYNDENHDVRETKKKLKLITKNQEISDEDLKYNEQGENFLKNFEEKDKDKLISELLNMFQALKEEKIDGENLFPTPKGGVRTEERKKRIHEEMTYRVTKELKRFFNDKYYSTIMSILDIKIVDIEETKQISIDLEKTKKKYIDLLTKSVSEAESYIKILTAVQKIKNSNKIIKVICEKRTKEGKYINKSLGELRNFVTWFLKQTTHNGMINFPPFVDMCIPLQCNPYLKQCFSGGDTTMSEPSSDIIKEIKTKMMLLSDNKEEEVKKRMKNLHMVIVNIVNFSRTVNNPPSVPYIDITNLIMEKQRLENISFYDENFLTDELEESKTSVNPLQESKTSVNPLQESKTSVNPLFLSQLQQVIDDSVFIKKMKNPVNFDLTYETKYDINSIDKDKERVLTEDFVNTTKEMINSLKEETILENSLIRLKQLITFIDNHNAASLIGTLVFLDAMSKFGNESLCTFVNDYPVLPRSEDDIEELVKDKEIKEKEKIRESERKKNEEINTFNTKLTDMFTNFKQYFEKIKY